MPHIRKSYLLGVLPYIHVPVPRLIIPQSQIYPVELDPNRRIPVVRKTNAYSKNQKISVLLQYYYIILKLSPSNYSGVPSTSAMAALGQHEILSDGSSDKNLANHGPLPAGLFPFNKRLARLGKTEKEKARRHPC